MNRRIVLSNLHRLSRLRRIKGHGEFDMTWVKLGRLLSHAAPLLLEEFNIWATHMWFFNLISLRDIGLIDQGRNDSRTVVND
jgi:hypothetical protein